MLQNCIDLDLKHQIWTRSLAVQFVNQLQISRPHIDLHTYIYMCVDTFFPAVYLQYVFSG